MKNQIDTQAIKQRFGIIGNAPMLNQALERATQVAPTEINVLITGESGTGKESFSKIIHQLSARKHANFTAVNCGAIPEGTIDSELFGHEKGAFTGAIDARKGFFEVSNGGTIFLDEVGEMPHATQARLLRVLEYGEYIKVGSSKVQKADVRVVAATNVNLEEAIKKGKFREDLYYRLSTVPIAVPALRERGDDIYLLFRKFAADFAEKYKSKLIELTDDAKKILMSYAFPGNIRQLKNLVSDLAVTSQENVITAEIFLQYLPKNTKSTLPMRIGANEGSESFSERELLYKILFDMRKDVTELKNLVFQILNSGAKLDASLLHQHQELFSEIQNIATNSSQNTNFTPNNVGNSYLTQPLIPANSSSNEGVLQLGQASVTEEGHTEDISHETEEETLSIEKKEKELIIRALKHHHNKRKYAAEDLGISERTLYRKIKIYGLD